MANVKHGVPTTHTHTHPSTEPQTTHVVSTLSHNRSNTTSHKHEHKHKHIHNISKTVVVTHVHNTHDHNDTSHALRAFAVSIAPDSSFSRYLYYKPHHELHKTEHTHSHTHTHAHTHTYTYIQTNTPQHTSAPALLVCNIPYHFTYEDVSELFACFGSVQSVRFTKFLRRE